MTYYPVIIPTLNRYEHFKECVESLAACTHADKTELVIGLDYPPSKKYVEGWKKIKEYITQIKGFQKVTVLYHNQNLGVTGNFKSLGSYVRKKYDAWISTEDDNVFSPCFLDFMNKCLEKYKDDENVIFICGCLEPNIKELLNNKFEKNTIIKVIGSYSSYGTGHWKTKNTAFKKKFPDDIQKYVFSSKINIIKLLKVPGKLNHIYFWINNNPKLNRNCDFTKNTMMVLNDQYNILPVISLVKNKGFDGTGINCMKSDIETNNWENMVISNDKTYELIDNSNKRNIKRNSKILFSDYSKNDLKAILPVILIYLIFGYKLSQKIIKYIHKIKH